MKFPMPSFARPYIRKGLPKACGLSSCAIIQSLTLREDLLAVLSQPPSAAPSPPLPSYAPVWAPPSQPRPPEPHPAGMQSRTNYQPGSNNPPGKVVPLRQVSTGECGPTRFATHWSRLICVTGHVIIGVERRLGRGGVLIQLGDPFRPMTPPWADIQSLLNVHQTGEEEATVCEIPRRRQQEE